MAGQVLGTPGFDLQPSAERVATSQNYITNFDFLNQYLPDTYEKEFERYGNRTVSAFLRLVGAEMPSMSDQVTWAEQGRLHTKYVNCASNQAAAQDAATITVNDALVPGSGQIAVRQGQTVFISDNAGGGFNKGLVTGVDYAAGTFDVAYYEGGGQVFGNTAVLTVFIYGSEFRKGTTGMTESLEADDVFFNNSPIIIRDLYEVSGSDMAQIGWVEISTEDGGTGYLWYLKSEHETRLRFDDYLETAMIEAVPAEGGSGVAALTSATNVGNKGSEGIFYVVGQRGNVWSGGNPTALADWDAVISRLDKQGAIEENVVFVDRDFGFDIDDMLAAQNSYGAGGTSYGLFDNDEEMALNLGFTGFRRGYDFYKTDWKYLNDPTMRGGLPTGASSGRVNGLLVPAGSTSVYDQILGKNAKRPFLHVRYRASQSEDRRYKTWITGSAGGARTSDLDAMQVNFLSERCVCTLGANNFFLFQE
ncbi:MAG: putative structural protein [Prokaryotic dsDNA virus sp.]|nr:MAG: putative structural protein [Prokaryotic dsDNA virus sp.]|tara:strand:- start:35474 stop:36901 length:1428 start_codon:yes stop_codon:yes gene_type:complete